ncbi:ABC transporter ATP-binding protein [bacterium]|jgi:ABC-type glutathione transport system ATPase component|nr:ABC transporter ATP-binding protein [bacterium]MBT4291323.1 ABC transporter ATP-binding protein [bacterium]MBT7311250.1 ABC transporter ATP-binding protein [bacterium]
MSNSAVLSATGVSIQTHATAPQLYEPFDIAVNAGECVALTGCSGTGKSLTVLSLIGLEPSGVISQGTVKWNDVVVDKTDRQQLAGKEVGLVLQDPVSALNPVISVGMQLQETVENLMSIKGKRAEKLVYQLMSEVQLQDVTELFYRYPHQLSVGQCQRIMIAMALAGNPKLLLADEPTTSLDVTVQREIIAMLTQVRKDRNMAMIIVSHDQNLVNDIADDIIELKACGEKHENVDSSLSSYQPSKKVSVDKIPLVKISDVTSSYDGKVVLNNLSATVKSGEFKVIAGNSGCGKTTLARLICGFKKADSGEIRINGLLLSDIKAARGSSAQLIFQNPFSSLDPRQTVRSILMEVITKFNGPDLDYIIKAVDLPRRLLEVKPHTLSGGECQRVAIARSLAASPELLIADEPTSSLDQIQSRMIMELLLSLCRNNGLTVILITHNLVEALNYADSFSIMSAGKIVEEMSPDDIPVHSITQKLLAAATDPAGLKLEFTDNC